MNSQRRSSLFVGALCSIFSLLACVGVNAQITHTLNTNALALAQNIAGAGVTVSNATLFCGSKRSGTFTAATSAITITDGIALSTDCLTGCGALYTEDYPNANADLLAIAKSVRNGITETNDECRLEFDLKVTTPQLEFKYVFGSDEYDQYIDTDFNDVFAFFISGPGITGRQNLAVIPGTTRPITISTINLKPNCYPQFFTNYNRAAATGLNGTTKVLTAKATVVPCGTYHLTLAIADCQDGALASTVWLQKGSLTSVGVTQQTPKVTGSLGVDRIYENCDNGKFTFDLNDTLGFDYGFRVKFKGTAINGTDYQMVTDTFTIPKGQKSISFDVIPINDLITEGSETVTVCVLEPCTNNELYCKTITIEELASVITPDTTICVTDSASLYGTYNPNYKYKWTPSTGIKCDTCYNPKASPALTTEYTLTVTDKTCSITKKVNVTVIRSDAGLDDSLTVCENGPTVDLFTKTVDAPPGGYWINPSGSVFTNPYNPPVHVPGKYQYAVSENGCPEDTSIMTVVEITLPNAGIDGQDTLCNNTNNGNLFNFITNEPTGGTWSGTAGGVNGTTGIVNVTSLAPGPYKFLYIVKGTTPCPTDTAIATVHVKALPTANFPAISPFCKGTTAYLKPKFTGVAPFSLTFTDCAGTSTTVDNLVNGDSIPITPTNSPCVYTITSVSDGGGYSCTNTATSTRSVSLLTPPTIQLDSLICNDSNTGYNVYLTLNGGNQPTYKINGATTGITGSKFKSALLPGGSTYNFTLSDQNGCLPVANITGFKNCDCTTDAGTMQNTIIEVCGSDSARSTANGDHTFDGNDIKMYILHDNPGQLLGNIIAINEKVPSFSYDTAWGIQYDQTYYISTVVGDRDPAMTTRVDTSNPNGCMSVASGQPVIFHQLPMATAVLDTNQVCIGQSANILFTFTAGKEPYDFDLLFNGATSVIPARTVANSSWTITPPIGSSTYTITKVTDKFGCSSELAIPLIITAVDRPDTNSVVLSCNNINTAYTVTFNVTGGDAASYTVNGVPFNGTTYTSTPITSGQPYDFRILDKNACLEVAVTGTNVCPCVTKAGTMTLTPTATPLEFCNYSAATATHNGDQVFDGNDVLSYVICTNPNDPIGSRLQHSKTPSFMFLPPMATGTTYFICPVAGDDDGNGLVNLNAACKDATGGTPVKFIAPPLVTISGDRDICENGSTPLAFNLTGNGGVKFTLNGSDGTTANHFAPAGPYSTVVTPTISSGKVTYTVDSVTVYDNTQPVNCHGTRLDSVVITIHPTPQASISGNFVICQGEDIALPIVTTGDATLTTTWSRGGGTTDSSFTAVAGTYQKVITKTLAPGSYTYRVNSVRDNTPAACPGLTSDSAIVLVQPTPAVTMNLLNDTICQNDASSLEFITSGNPTFNVYYREDNTKRVRTPLPVGSTVFSVSPNQTQTYTIDSITDGTLSSRSNRSCFRTYNTSVTLTVIPLPTGRLSGNTEICLGESAYIQFKLTGGDDQYAITGDYRVENEETGAISQTSFTTNNENDSVLVSPTDTTTYTLIKVTDKYGCVATTINDSAYIPVNPIPVPIIAASDTASCPPLVTNIMNLTDSKYLGNYTWHYGDNTTSSGNGADPGMNKTYNEPGSYDVRLEVTSPQGCYKDTLIEKFLTVHPFPHAEFNWQPHPTTVIDSYVHFNNLSTGDDFSSWRYFTSSGVLLDTSDVRDPQFVFPDLDTGSYPVQLVVTTEYGCQDSIVHTVVIEGIFDVYAPNTFTPNGDGVNDVFRPVMVGEKAQGYELAIFNRWGEALFVTKDRNAAWDGTYQGLIVKEDVYIFHLRVRSRYNAEKREFIGQVRVLK